MLSSQTRNVSPCGYHLSSRKIDSSFNFDFFILKKTVTMKLSRSTRSSTWLVAQHRTPPVVQPYVYFIPSLLFLALITPSMSCPRIQLSIPVAWAAMISLNNSGQQTNGKASPRLILSRRAHRRVRVLSSSPVITGTPSSSSSRLTLLLIIPRKVSRHHSPRSRKIQQGALVYSSSSAPNRQRKVFLR
jgi:hypothetical protein